MTIKHDLTQRPERELNFRYIPTLIKDFTYKPNWFLESKYQIDYDRVLISLCNYVEDSRADFEQWDVITRRYSDTYDAVFGTNSYDRFDQDLLVRPIASPVSPRRPVLPVYNTVEVPRSLETEREFWYWLRYQALPILEEHEMDEWFKVRGELMFDPHKQMEPMSLRELEIRNGSSSRH